MQFKIDYKTINIHTKVGVLPIRIAKSNVSSVGPSSERNSAYAATRWFSDEGPTLETLNFTIRIGSTPFNI